MNFIIVLMEIWHSMNSTKVKKWLKHKHQFSDSSCHFLQRRRSILTNLCNTFINKSCCYCSIIHVCVSNYHSYLIRLAILQKGRHIVRIIWGFAHTVKALKHSCITWNLECCRCQKCMRCNYHKRLSSTSSGIRIITIPEPFWLCTSQKLDSFQFHVGLCVWNSLQNIALTVTVGHPFAIVWNFNRYLNGLEWPSCNGCRNITSDTMIATCRPSWSSFLYT